MKTVAETDKQRWARETLAPALAKSPDRSQPFTTISGRPIERLYTADDLDGIDASRDSAVAAGVDTVEIVRRVKPFDRTSRDRGERLGAIGRLRERRRQRFARPTLFVGFGHRLHTLRL